MIPRRASLHELASELIRASEIVRTEGRDRGSPGQVLAGAPGPDGRKTAHAGTRRGCRVDAAVELMIVQLAIDQPAFGQVEVANRLRARGLVISSSGVRSVWQRHDMETFPKRLQALKARIAREGLVASEAQAAALMQERNDHEARGEFESEHPGYCGAQDTFYIGPFWGARRVYQQTFVDTYSRLAFAKLYDSRTPITGADLLNDRVMPFFDAHGVRLCRVLTDRGAEYCGASPTHKYRLYLSIEDIDHLRTRTKNPQVNGAVQGLHQRMLEGLYHDAIRRSKHISIAEMQAGLDQWMSDYNERTACQERWCYGKTPMQTFVDAIPLARPKRRSADG